MSVFQEAIDFGKPFCENGIEKDRSFADFYKDVRQLHVIDCAERCIAHDAFNEVDERHIESVPRYGEHE